MTKSVMENGSAPNWYRDLHCSVLARYYGSRASITEGEVYVPHGGQEIVTCADGVISVMDNVCLHAGAKIFDKHGSHNGADIRCPIHLWMYDKKGELRACPHFEKKPGARLASREFSEWNGYIIGYPDGGITHLKGFGSSFGLPEDHLDVRNFIFFEEIVYVTDYHFWLMVINYLDGLHVRYAHPLSFDAAVDRNSYEWEIKRTGLNGYSIQKVMLRENLEQHVENLMRVNNTTRETLGWADLVLWMREVMPKDVWEADVPYFALWGLDYRSLLMWESYLNGLFLVTSSLLPNGPNAKPDNNLNVVEFYMSPRIPEVFRRIALQKFIRAYEQSAREDDVLCRRLWSAHQREDIDFRRSVHDEFEKGDHDFRDWVTKNSVRILA